jgi:lysozyme
MLEMPSSTRLFIFVALLLAAAAAIWLHASNWHPSLEKFPRQGIDVSHHQGPIAWQELAGQGVSFAYIKATEGGDYKDRRFSDNWNSAKNAGIARGAYHFFTLCRAGADQARNFIDSVPVEIDALPPAVDLEFMGNCSTWSIKSSNSR